MQTLLDTLEPDFVERFGQMVQDGMSESYRTADILSYVRYLYERWHNRHSWFGEDGTPSNRYYRSIISSSSIEGSEDIEERLEDIEVEDEHSKNVSVNKPDKRSWLTCPIGLEYTFHYVNKKRPRFTEAEDRLVDKLNETLPKTNESIVYLDAHCVEIGSPVHRTWKQCSKYYRQVIIEAKKYRLHPTSRKHGGGGCHINVSIPKNRSNQPDHRFMLKLLCDLVNRPYINWIFNEPSDNHTANCYALRLTKLLKERKPTDTDEAFWPTIRNYFDDRGMSIRIKDSSHFELRCFDMVRNERDLKDVLTFVSKYLKMIKSQKKMTKCVWDLTDFDSDDRDLQPIINVTKSEVLTEFKKLLIKLQLDYKDYRRFVERNLNRRFSKTYGEEYLR